MNNAPLSECANASAYVRALTVFFEERLSWSEVPLLRGAIIEKSAGLNIEPLAEVFFHNHIGEKDFRFSYPLIQYKRLNGKAAIVGVGEAIEPLSRVLSLISGDIRLGEKSSSITIRRVYPQRVMVGLWNVDFRYKLEHWVALNAENYRTYVSTENLIERIGILERVLKGNLLSFCKGMGIFLEKELTVSILSISSEHLMKFKDVKLMVFDCEFKTNLSLPDFVGIGKNASIGCGIVKMIKG